MYMLLVQTPDDEYFLVSSEEIASPESVVRFSGNKLGCVVKSAFFSGSDILDVVGCLVETYKAEQVYNPVPIRMGA